MKKGILLAGMMSLCVFAESFAIRDGLFISKLFKARKAKKNVRPFATGGTKVRTVDEKKTSLPPTQSTNIISANGGNGIFLTNNSNNNVIQDNVIGQSASSTPLGNGQDGVAIEYFSSNNVVGGSGAANGNIIANNKKGVVVGENKCDLSVGNSILSNSIFNNKCIGIDLANDNKTPNHKTSPTFGPNNFQNYPVLYKARAQASNTKIAGFLKSVPNSSFIIQFFSNPKNGNEGQAQIGQITVSTNAQGKVEFTALALLVAPGTSITATATLLSSSGLPTDTSEFSKPITVKNCK